MTYEELKKHVRGIWLGKAIGGTLGQPWEGCNGPLNLSFYDPVPTGMMPNDDLDLQVVWGCHLATDWKGVVSHKNFAQAWLNNIDFPFDEYGIVIRNLKLGIPAPWTGRFDNAFTDGLGGAIRAEIWAVLAPNNPQLAAKMAGMDAEMDHAGNGVYAEQFIAAMESAAFTEKDIPTLIQIGLSVIPAASRLSQAINDTIQWCQHSSDIFEVRRKIMENYASPNFTDVKMNLSFVTAAMLLGEGDFEKTICHAVNCGQDADCTGATVGAIMGVINPDGIPEKWLQPIGNGLILNEGILGINPPADLDGFTDMLLELQGKVTIDDDSAPEPDFTPFQIPCRQSYYQPWFALDYRRFNPQPAADAKEITLPGNLITVDFSQQPGESLQILEIPFKLESARTVRVLVNTPANMLVWIDGKFAFGRDGGPFVPAFHRAHINQLVEINLEGGEHQLRIGLAPANPEMTSAELLFGIADPQNRWIINAFYDVK